MAQGEVNLAFLREDRKGCVLQLSGSYEVPRVGEYVRGDVEPETPFDEGWHKVLCVKWEHTDEGWGVDIIVRPVESLEFLPDEDQEGVAVNDQPLQRKFP